MSSPYAEGVMRLRDGRRLAFAQFGAPAGKPVFWFHGTPGARRQIPPDTPEVAVDRGVRVIGVDRPGTGQSSHHRRGTLLSWADDIAELADHLSVDRFAAIGLSGGGPYVLACAHQMPERMVLGVSLGGIGPIVGPDAAPYPRMLRAVMNAVSATRTPLGLMLSGAVQPLRPLVSPVFDLYTKFGPRSDRPVLRRPEMKAMFARDIVRATRSGLRGPVHDIHLFSRPWRFSPRDIRVPILFWHGDADEVVPLAHGQHLASLVPDSQMTIVPGLGHFAGFTTVAAVLDALVARWA